MVKLVSVLVGLIKVISLSTYILLKRLGFKGESIVTLATTIVVAN